MRFKGQLKRILPFSYILEFPLSALENIKWSYDLTELFDAFLGIISWHHSYKIANIGKHLRYISYQQEGDRRLRQELGGTQRSDFSVGEENPE